MNPEPPIDQETHDSIPDICTLSDSELELAERARIGLAHINAVHAVLADSSINDSGQVETKAYFDDEEQVEEAVPRLVLPSLDFLAAIAAVTLPPSDIPALLDDSKKVTWDALHKICITFETGFIRLTNAIEGTTCELRLPVPQLATWSTSRSIRVASAQLEALINHRAYRTGHKVFDLHLRNARSEKRDWRYAMIQAFDTNHLPAINLSISPDWRVLKLEFGSFSAEIIAEACATPEPVPAAPDDATRHHALQAQELRKAIAFAATFSGLAHANDRWWLVSLADGTAMGGGHPGAFSRYTSGLLDGFVFDLPAGEVRAFNAILHRIENFALWTADQTLYLSDGRLSAMTLLSPSHFPAKIPPNLADLSQHASSVSLAELSSRIKFVSTALPPNSRTDPNHIHIGLGKDENYFIEIIAVAPNGDYGRAPVDLARPPADVPEGEMPRLAVQLATLRLACQRGDQYGTLKFLPHGVSVTIVDGGATLAHFLAGNASVKPVPTRIARRYSADQGDFDTAEALR